MLRPFCVSLFETDNPRYRGMLNNSWRLRSNSTVVQEAQAKGVREQFSTLSIAPVVAHDMW
jgi:hypothetical protein